MYLEQVDCPADLKQLSVDELCALAEEIRSHLIESVARTGGHIGPNLGVVELTIALHYVFDSPVDSFLWDVSHQTYVHKMLTGRRGLLRTMRQDGGSPGFSCRTESEHDLLDVSHGGTSLSVALGIALANRLSGDPGTPIAIIGDSALGEGVALEALNQAGHEKPRMLVVVNDNGWGITSNETALRDYLASRHPGDQAEESFFTALGLKYVGPLDGHDIPRLVEGLQALRGAEEAIVLHVTTRKGHGLPYADENVTKYHFSFPFDVESGTPVSETEGSEEGIYYKPTSPFNAGLIGRSIEQIAVGDPRVVVVTPATIGAVELLGVFEKLPERAFDVGMAEQHALSLGVGLALQGMKPIIAYQSTFFQRAFDQLVHDVCSNDIPMIIILARSGLAGLDHSTHHATLDLSYLRCVPNLQIHFPSDHQEFITTLNDFVVNWVQHPTVLLFPYGTLDMVEPSGHDRQLLSEDPFSAANQGIVLTTAGRLVSAAEVKRQLCQRGVEWGVLNVAQLKPLDKDLFGRIFDQYDRVVTMEENVANGGFGSSVIEVASDGGWKPDVIRVTLGDQFSQHGTREYLFEKHGIDAASVVDTILERWPDCVPPGA